MGYLAVTSSDGCRSVCFDGHCDAVLLETGNVYENMIMKKQYYSPHAEILRFVPERGFAISGEWNDIENGTPDITIETGEDDTTFA